MNFLAQKRRVIAVKLAREVALDAIGKRMSGLQVRKSWRDVLNPLIRNAYLQRTDSFGVTQRISTGRNNIDIAAVGVCSDTSADSCEIVVYYDVYPKWLRWFFWIFLCIALIITLSLIPALITTGATPDNFFVLIIPGFFIGIIAFINALLQSKLDGLHQTIIKALRERERSIAGN